MISEFLSECGVAVGYGFSILDIHKDIQLFTYFGRRVFSLGTNNLALITGLLSEMQAENREVPCSTGRPREMLNENSLARGELTK